MTITKDEALQKAQDYLASKMEGRLEIVDHISGCLYGANKIDFTNNWIIYVRPEDCIIDGPEKYILIEKKTGIIMELTSC